MAESRRPRPAADGSYIRKLIIVGDVACGKTRLLIRYTNDGFDPEGYIPTVFNNYIADVNLPDGRHVKLALWDTAGQEDYDLLRPLSYPGTDVVLICISVDLPDSLQNVYDKWIQEVKHFCPGLPVVLVGCNKDLRNDEVTKRKLWQSGGRNPLTEHDGLKAAAELDLDKYLECSTRTGEGVKTVFEEAARISLDRMTHSHSSRPQCVIL